MINYLFTFAFLLLFFGILGLHLFRGLTENRCRYSESPPLAETWTVNPNFKYLCGDIDCPLKFVFLFFIYYY